MSGVSGTHARADTRLGWMDLYSPRLYCKKEERGRGKYLGKIYTRDVERGMSVCSFIPVYA